MDHESVMNLLARYGKEIGKKQSEGDDYASRVVSLYKMYYAHPDTPTLALLGSALDDYLAHRNVGYTSLAQRYHEPGDSSCTTK